VAKRSSINRQWKAFETMVARDFGTERTPLSGSNSRHETHSDSLHEDVYIESKRDQGLIGARFARLIEDTMKKAKAENKIPMIAFKIKGKRGYMIVCHRDDLKGLASEMIYER